MLDSACHNVRQGFYRQRDTRAADHEPETMMQTLYAHRYGLATIGQVVALEVLRRELSVTLPSHIGHGRTAFPRGDFDRQIKRGISLSDADGVTYTGEVAA